LCLFSFINSHLLLKKTKYMAINERATVEVQVNGQQAKQELRDLESYANSLKGRLAEAYKTGDTKQIKKLEAELKKTNAELKTMRTNARNIDVVMQNLSTAGPKELRQLLKDINAKLNSGHIKRGSAEWKMYQERLKLVNAELRKINAEVKETQSWLTRFNNGFSRWGGLLASGAAAITGVSFALSKLRNNRDDKEDSAANLKALTGLDDKSIQWLTRQAEILSTTMDKTGLRVTQSSKDILEAYMLVGSNKPELLSDKEALNAVTIETMRLSAASKMDLAKSVEATTTALNQYGAGADQAARYVNVLAAGSKYGAANVEQQTAAILKAGTMAASSNISLEELVATIEMLGEKGLKNEIAGTGLKTFFTRLSTGAVDTNPKVVGLSVALDNLNKKVEDAERQAVGGGTTLLKKLFGDEGMTTAMILAQNTEKVKEYTRAVTGTSVAMEQAAINSDTAKAKRAQYINQIKEAGIILMEKLNPSLSALTGWTTKLIKAAPELIDWLQKYGKVLAYAIIVVASYTAANKLQWFWLNKVKTETGKYIVVQKLKEFWDKAIAASTWLYIAATSALTGKIGQAKLAMQAFFMILKMNPFGAVATLIVGVAGALYLYSKRMSEANKRKRELNEINLEAEKSIGEEKNKLEALRKVLEDSKQSYGKRKAALEEIQTIVPEYHASLTEEGRLINNNTQALDGYVEKLLLTAKQQAANAKLQEVLNQRSEWIRENGSDAMKFKSLEWEINDPSNMGKSLEELAVTNSISPTAYRVWSAKKKQLDEEVRYYEQMMQGYTNQLMAIDEKYKTNNNNNDGNDDDKKKCPRCGNNPCTCTKDDNKLTKAETDYYKRITEIKNRYLTDSRMSQDDYHKEMQDAEMQLLQDKLSVAGLEPSERQKINNQLLDMEIKMRDELEKKEEKRQQEAEKKRKETSEQAFSARERQYQLEIEDATMYHYQNKTSEESYYQELKRIQDKYYDDILNSTEYSEEQKNKIRDKKRQEDLDAEKKAAEQKKNKEQQTYNILEGLATDYGNAIADVLTDSEVTFKDFLKEMLKASLDALEKFMILKVAQRTIANLGELGFWGLVKAAGEIALITAAFETAKSAIGNFYTGGFTSPGEWDKPQGIVHSNEFVANRFAVANPEILPVLKLIDTAQKNNTVGKLTSQDVSGVLRNGGQNQAAAVEVIQATDPEIKQLIAECTTVMQTVKKRFEKRIVAETYLTGKGGINQAQKEYKKLDNNKSRNKQ
jgi:TP901 family phage tail tape measure protein